MSDTVFNKIGFRRKAGVADEIKIYGGDFKALVKAAKAAKTDSDLDAIIKEHGAALHRAVSEDIEIRGIPRSGTITVKVVERKTDSILAEFEFTVPTE